MFSPREPEYDYYCPHCGRGDYFEVGFGPSQCPGCGGSLFSRTEPETPYDASNDDVILHPDFLRFDSYKAFRLLLQLGLLEQCFYDEVTDDD
jgi:hypothetical protein